MADNTGPQSNMPDRTAMTESNAPQPDANAGEKKDSSPATIGPSTTKSSADAGKKDGPFPATTEAEVNASQPSADATKQKDSPLTIAPIIIGIYGISGVGKTHLCEQLKQRLDEDRFTFFEGSEALAARTGGIEAFNEMSTEEKDKLRTEAIESIRDQCVATGKIGIVTGHFMFFTQKSDEGEQATFLPVVTDADKRVYTHIIYLYTEVQNVLERIQRDLDSGKKTRSKLSQVDTQNWMDGEKSSLSELCPKHSIVYTSIDSGDSDRAETLIQAFATHNEHDNTNRAYKVLEDGLSNGVKTVLIFDADKTLSSQDASAILFGQGEKDWFDSSSDLKLKDIFGSPPEYSYTTFRQVTLHHEKLLPDEEAFDKACDKAAAAIKLRPEFRFRLQEASQDKTVGVVVATCGVRRIWEKVLKREGINAVLVAGGRLSDGYVVTPDVKGALVTRLRQDRGVYVCAIGDSVVDLQMLKNADQSFIVVGNEDERSKSMDTPLGYAIDKEGLRVHQFLIPSDTTPRLEQGKVPIAELDSDFINRISQDHALKVHQLTTKAATKLLATNTRAKTLQGPGLHKAHKKVGWYLSMECVSEILGVESFEMQSVSKDDDKGHRLLNEHKTLIVPLMRGGDPMAHGVFEAFPNAMYFQSKLPEEITMDHIKDKWTIILVDWVVNSGDNILKYVRYIRTHLSRQIRIVVVAGVVQEDAVQGKDGIAAGGKLQQGLKGLGEVTLVALRTSKNKYQGLGLKDTGHRLFNSTHLE